MLSLNASGQVMKQTIVVTIDQLDYESMCPGIGIVSGYYTYEFNLKLSDEGYLERMNWHVGKSYLYNDKGDKVHVIDSGTDNLGIVWDFFNNANFYNWYLYNCPELVYSPGDGWLDGYLPPVMPSEGITCEMSCKVMCKGVIFDISFMAKININANGEIVVDFTKP